MDAQYKYDPFGRRIEKNVNGQITRYVYDGDNIFNEYDGANNIKAKYVFSLAIDDPLSVEQAGSVYYYHKDSLGSVTELTNATGSVVKTYRYNSFGEIYSQTGSLIQPFTFTGREYDPESGLYYYRARYYDPAAGVFIGKDPIGFDSGGINFFSYVGNNPLNLIDPMGLKVNVCWRQAFASEWGKKHRFYVIPHCYLIAKDQIFSWNLQREGGIHDKENPCNNECDEIKCNGDEPAFENCVYFEASASQGHEGNTWIPTYKDCCHWVINIIVKCMKKHCTN